MALSEAEARQIVSKMMMSPTLLTQRRGLRRPMPVKTLSMSQSGSQSVSSRATSRRSKSIVSTPEEQRLFENLSSSLAVSALSPSSVNKNKLDRFQQKKHLPPSDNKPMVHPMQTLTYQSYQTRNGRAEQRYFSIGGKLSIDRPGKVTPTVFVLDEPDPCLKESYSSESDAFVDLPPTESIEDDEDAFVDLPTVTNTRRADIAEKEDSKSIISLEKSILDDDHPDDADDEHSSVDLSAVVFSTDQAIDVGKALRDARNKSLSSTFKILFGNDDGDGFDVAPGDEHSSIHLSSIGSSSSSDSEENYEESTVDLSTVDQSRTDVSTLCQSTVDQSTIDQSTVGHSTLDQATSEQCTLDQSTVGQSTYGRDSTLAYSTTFASQETGQNTTSSYSMTTGRFSEGASRSTTTRSSAESSSERDTYQSTTNSCENSTLHSTAYHSTVNSCEVSTVRSVGTNFEGRNTAKAVESILGFKLANQQIIQTVESPTAIRAQDEEDQEKKEQDKAIERSGSDVSDITTLSTAQNRGQGVPVMNYSNLFSTGSTSLWSRHDNLKKDDDIFMSRAQTMLDFFESRLNSDKTEIILIPEDKKELDQKFNLSNRLRFIESLRMRCVVKSEKTEAIVKRCCKLGLDREGAQNPIFATRALVDQIVTIKISQNEDKSPNKNDAPTEHSGDPHSKNETASMTVSLLSIHSSEWGDPIRQKIKKRNPKIFQPDCSAQMCGISLLICVND